MESSNNPLNTAHTIYSPQTLPAELSNTGATAVAETSNNSEPRASNREMAAHQEEETRPSNSDHVRDGAHNNSAMTNSLEHELRKIQQQNEELDRIEALQRQIQQAQEKLKNRQAHVSFDTRQNLRTTAGENTYQTETPHASGSPRYTGTHHLTDNTCNQRYRTEPNDRNISRQTMNGPADQHTSPFSGIEYVGHREPDYNIRNLHLGTGNMRIENSRWLQNFKFDIEDAKGQFNYFNARMEDHGILDDHDKYVTIREYWPNKDMNDYILCTEEKDRNFASLKNYLLTKDGFLPRVLLPKAEIHSISGCDLNNEVSKWMLEFEDKEVLQKFVYMHLMPKHLKDKIASNLSLGLAEFRRCVVDLCDADKRNPRGAATQVKYYNKPERTRGYYPPIQRRFESPPQQTNYGRGQPRNPINNPQRPNYNSQPMAHETKQKNDLPLSTQ